MKIIELLVNAMNKKPSKYSKAEKKIQKGSNKRKMEEFVTAEGPGPVGKKTKVDKIMSKQETIQILEKKKVIVAPKE